MAKIKIYGGYILTPRRIQDSIISQCPPCVREVFNWLVMNAAFKDKKEGRLSVKRGQLLIGYQDIIDGLAWKVGFRTESYSMDQVKKAMKTLKELHMVEVQKVASYESTNESTNKAPMKAPKGCVVTVCKYVLYQDISSYESTNESTNESTMNGTSIYIEDERKENKENNKGRHIKDSAVVDEEGLLVFQDQEKYEAFLKEILPEEKDYRRMGFNQLSGLRHKFLSVIKERGVNKPKNYFRKWLLGEFEKGNLKEVNLVN
jgi:hypothetical protein